MNRSQIEITATRVYRRNVRVLPWLFTATVIVTLLSLLPTSSAAALDGASQDEDIYLKHSMGPKRILTRSLGKRQGYLKTSAGPKFAAGPSSDFKRAGYLKTRPGPKFRGSIEEPMLRKRPSSRLFGYHQCYQLNHRIICIAQDGHDKRKRDVDDLRKRRSSSDQGDCFKLGDRWFCVRKRKSMERRRKRRAVDENNNRGRYEREMCRIVLVEDEIRCIPSHHVVDPREGTPYYLPRGTSSSVRTTFRDDNNIDDDLRQVNFPDRG